MKWVRFWVVCPSAAVEAVVGLMLESASSGPVVEDAGDMKRVSVYVPAGPEAEGTYMDLRTRLLNIPGYLTGGALLRVEHEQVQDEDWAQAWKDFYEPLRIGRRLVIKPSWEPWPPEGDPGAARADDLVIELDPEMAFGTGNHASTQLCLVALEDLVRPGLGVLDVGCGSGTLALAAAKLGALPVVAVDVDAVAVQTAQANVERNALGGSVTVLRGDLTAAQSGESHLIVANINAPVVRELAGPVAACLMQAGYYLASGLVDHSVPEVRQAMERAGLAVVDVRRQEGWACVIGRKGT